MKSPHLEIAARPRYFEQIEHQLASHANDDRQSASNHRVERTSLNRLAQRYSTELNR